MRKLAFLLILLIIPIASSQEILYSRNVNLDITQEVEVTTLNVDEFTLNFFIYPKADFYSEVSNIRTYPQASLSNNSYVFTQKNPPNVFNYKLNSEVSNSFKLKKIKNKINFPFVVPEEYEKYTEPTDLCDSDNLEIRKLANSLAVGEVDAYKIVFNLAKWVKYNIEYDLSYSAYTSKASEVLRNKKGTCDEYSNILMALLRSLGIPARYVTGYSYGSYETEGFESHGWVEVWFPDHDWIPVDPTYGEVGWIDSTHVKSFTSRELGISSVEYEWVGGDFKKGELSTNVSVISYNEKLPIYLDGELYVEEKSISKGSCNVIWLNITNPNSFYVSTISALRVAPEVVGTNEKLVLLEPKSTKKIGWIVKYPLNLSDNYIYTYLINQTSYFMKYQSDNTIVKSNEESLSLSECRSILDVSEDSAEGYPEIYVTIRKPKEVKLGDDFQIVVNLLNKGSAPLEDLVVCLDGECNTRYVGINDEIKAEFALKASSLGRKEFLVTFDNLNISSQEVEITVVEKNLIEKIIDFFKNLFKLK